MHLSNENLIACLDGEASEYLTHHLDDCSSCATALEPYRTLQNNLLQTLYRSHCPPSQLLSNFHLGLLNKEENDAVTVHISECFHCQTEIERLREFLEEEIFLS